MKISISDMGVFHLVSDKGSFTGYRWEAFGKPQTGSDSKLGIPASLFEVALWKELDAVTKKLIEAENKLKNLEPMFDQYYSSDRSEIDR